MTALLDADVSCSVTPELNQQIAPANADVLVNDGRDHGPVRPGRHPIRISCHPTPRPPAATGQGRTLARHGGGDTRATTQTTLTATGRDDTAGEIPTVEIDTAPAAHCCGAAGCHTTEGLQEVTIDGAGTWVVCPDHLAELVERKTGVAFRHIRQKYSLEEVS